MAPPWGLPACPGPGVPISSHLAINGVKTFMFLLLSLPHARARAVWGCRGGFQASPLLEHHGQQRKPSRYRGHQGHSGAQTEHRLRHEGWLLFPQLSARPEEKASQHTEKQGVIFLQGLCRRQAQPGARPGPSITPQGCEMTPRHLSLSGSPCPCFERG